jgi:hypothetical protein
MDDLVDVPEHTRQAAITALFRRDKRRREIAVLDAAASQPLIDGSVLADDPNRRALFLSDVARRIMAHGTQKTSDFLRKLYHFSKRQSMAIIKEARIELAADMATAREELRGVANARVEDLMRRAREACDISNEIKALKEWMRLFGLYDTDDAGLGDFAALMRKVTAEADANVIDAEFTVEVKEEETTPRESWAIPERIETLKEADEEEAAA